MTQKVGTSKSWSSVPSVLDDGHMNERDMVGEMEGIRGFPYTKAKLTTAATEYPTCQQQRTTLSL